MSCLARIVRAILLPALLPVAAHAQVAPSPRLEFTPAEWDLARGVARQPELAAWYGSTGLAPMFTSADAAPRRAALVAAVGQAAAHGLPDTYGADRLLALENRTDPVAEIAFAQVFADWTHDVGGGVLDPRRVDSENRREVIRVPTDELLARFVAASDPAAMLAGVPPQGAQYRALQAALAAQMGPVVGADVPHVPPGLWREGMRDAAISRLRARLAALGFAADSPDPELFDSGLVAQVAAYQTRVGLHSDGIAGPRTVDRMNGGSAPRDLLVALERMRWLNGHDLNARMIWVNLPEFNVRVMEGGHTIYESRAVIGKDKDDWRTPEFSDILQNVVVNPSWNVPRSMAIRDYLPRLQQNRHAVAHLDVVDSRGRVVARDGIDFSRFTAKTFPYRLRQKPSDDNALGEVKFIFPNPMNIYLHDTPSKGLFGERTRAFSNGCIRVQKPVDLAHVLLEGAVDDPAATYARARQSGNERFLKTLPLPVHIVYFTTIADEDGAVRHFPDVYGRDAAVWAALKARAPAGVETAALAE
ncbi:L,D-transpeptidase family protein [Paracoccus sp. MC1854]|nr:L,D-transpeptidase family protein [Paracoccus sp. MC1854]